MPRKTKKNFATNKMLAPNRVRETYPEINKQWTPVPMKSLILHRKRCKTDCFHSLPTTLKISGISWNFLACLGIFVNYCFKLINYFGIIIIITFILGYFILLSANYQPYRLINGLSGQFSAFYSALGSWLRAGPTPVARRSAGPGPREGARGAPSGPGGRAGP